MNNFVTPKNAQIVKIDGHIELATDLKILKLALGDQLIAGESLALSQGASVTLQYADGTVESLTFSGLNESQFLTNNRQEDSIDEIIAATEQPTALASNDDLNEIAAIQDLIESGEGDLDLPATAAGGNASEGGTGFTSIDRTADETLATAGFDTSALINAIPTVNQQSESTSEQAIAQLFAPAISFIQDGNSDNYLNALESAPATLITIGLDNTNAKAGDTLIVNDNQITLSQEQITAGQVTTEIATPSTDEPISVTASINGIDGNVSPESNAQIALDRKGPTLEITSSHPDPLDSNSSEVTFQFSEAVTGFDLNDVILTGGTITNFQQIDADTWTANFIPTPGDTIDSNIVVEDATYTDIAGNPGSGNGLILVDTPPSLELTAITTINENEAAIGDKVADFTATDVEDGLLNDKVTFSPNTNNEGFYQIVGSTVVLTENGVKAINAGVILPEIALTVFDSNGKSAIANDTPSYIPQDDIPTLTPDTGSVTEDVTDGSGNLVTSGTLTPGINGDQGEDKFSPETINGTYGTLTVDEDGQWVYTADNNQPSIQQLEADTTPLSDIFEVTNADGVTKTTITITINGADDGGTIIVVGDDSDTGSVTEDQQVVAGKISTSGNLSINDADATDTVFSTVVVSNGPNYLGQLTIDEDGQWQFEVDNNLPAIQVLDSNETITQSYTITTADGNDSHSITITINGMDEAPTIIITDKNGIQVGDLSIQESQENTDTFAIDVPSGIKHMSIAGTQVDLANPSATPIETAGGSLTIISITDGIVSYSYAAKTQDHSTGEATDQLNILITDNLDRTVTETLTVNITDTAPTANDDANSVTESNSEATTTVSGNVVTGEDDGTIAPSQADSLGADATALTQVTIDGSDYFFVDGDNAPVDSITIDTAYGQLTIGTDGQYSFALDNTKAAVNALTAASSAQLVVNYTLTDADNSSDNANLVIAINGSDEGTTVTVPNENGADAGHLNVVEASSNTGAFTFTTAADSATVTINGVTAAPNATVTTANGTLTITSVSAGQVDYTYASNGAEDHALAPITDDFTVIVSDGINPAVTDTLTVNITDTAPTANDDANSVTESNSEATTTVSGNVVTGEDDGTIAPSQADSLGADATALTQVTIDGSDYFFVDGDNAPVDSITIDTAYGQLTIGTDGQYSFALDNTKAAVNALTAASSAQLVVNYTLTDADNSSDNANLVIAINGANEPPTAEDFTVDLGVSPSGSFTFSAHVADIEDDLDVPKTDVMVKINSLPQGNLYLIEGNTETLLSVGDEISENATLRYDAIDESEAVLFNAKDAQDSGLLTSGLDSLTINDITITGHVYTGDAPDAASYSSNLGLAYDAGDFNNGVFKEEHGIGVVSDTNTDPEINTANKEFINIAFANDVNHVNLELASLWGNYISTTANAVVHVLILKDGEVIGKQEYSDLNVVSDGTGIYTADINIQSEFDELRVYSTADYGSNFLVREISVLEQATNDSLTYHAIDSDGLTSGPSNTVNFAMSKEVIPLEAVAPEATGLEDQFIELLINPIDDDTSNLTIIISDIPPGSTLRNASGELTITDNSVALAPEQLVGLEIKAPQHSDVDFTLEIELKTASSAGNASSSIVVSQQVTVGAVADAPTLNLDVDIDNVIVHTQSVINTDFTMNVDYDGKASVFIDEIDGWKPATNEKIELRRPIESTDADPLRANQFIELDADPKDVYDDATSIHQTILTEAGKLYTLTFDYSAREGYDDTYMNFNVLIDADGNNISTTNYTADGTVGSGNSGNTWYSSTVTFIGTGGDVELTFIANGQAKDYGRGMFIDNIALGYDDTVTIPLTINPILVDQDGSESLAQTVTLGDLPTNAILSAGTVDQNGLWTVELDDLPTLTITMPKVTASVAIEVTASTIEASNGSTASTTQTLSFDISANGVTLPEDREQLADDAASVNEYNGSILYMATSNGEIVGIDIRDGKTLIEFNPLGKFVNLATNVHGELFSTKDTGSGNNTVYQLDKQTGAILSQFDATYNSNALDITSMAFDNDNTLYVRADDTIYTVDGNNNLVPVITLNGSATASFGGNNSTGEFAVIDGKIYTFSTGGTAELYEIDPALGNVPSAYTSLGALSGKTEGITTNASGQLIINLENKDIVTLTLGSNNDNQTVLASQSTTPLVDNFAGFASVAGGDSNNLAKSTISDNVLANDTTGANPTVVRVKNYLNNESIDTDGTTVIEGMYGSLTMAADGSYTYSLDNANSTVQALKTGEILSDEFTYIVASDSGFGEAQLNITINGASDDITGDEGDNILSGSSLDDTIIGGLGDDTIIGGLGNDLLEGGAGEDTYVWLNGDKGIDEIVGFSQGEDKLDLKDLLNLDNDDTLDGYLNFSTDGDNTIIDIDTDGDDLVEQSIVLHDVNLEQAISSGDYVTLNSLFTNDGSQNLLTSTQGATYNETKATDYDDTDHIM